MTKILSNVVIPGLKEVESALEDVATWSYIRRDETPPEYDLQSMQMKYPRAFAYLKSREYERSANRMKAQAGRDAVVKIVNGEDYQAVIAEMEELVAEHIFSSIVPTAKAGGLWEIISPDWLP